MNLIFPLRLFQLLGLLPETPPPESDEPEGEIVDVVRPNEEWRIKFRASYWTARSKTPANFQPGDRVRIIGHRIVDDRTSNTLLIDRL
jgi:hypothetical protein